MRTIRCAFKAGFKIYFEMLRTQIVRCRFVAPRQENAIRKFLAKASVRAIETLVPGRFCDPGNVFMYRLGIESGSFVQSPYTSGEGFHTEAE